MEMGGDEDSVRQVQMDLKLARVHPDLALDRGRWLHITRRADLLRSGRKAEEDVSFE